MNMLMEVALLVGSIFAAIKMAGYIRITLSRLPIYFLNESLGRPVQKWRHRSWQYDHRYSAECSLLAWPVRSGLRKAPIEDVSSANA